LSVIVNGGSSAVALCSTNGGSFHPMVKKDGKGDTIHWLQSIALEKKLIIAYSCSKLSVES
jgi:hypothetical protein